MNPCSCICKKPLWITGRHPTETKLFEGCFITESFWENVPIIQKRSGAMSMHCECHIKFNTENAKDD